MRYIYQLILVIILIIPLFLGIITKADQIPLYYQTNGLPKILLINTGNSLPVPSPSEIAEINSLVGSMSKDNQLFYLGYKSNTNQYAVFSNIRIAQIFPPNAYDSFIVKLKVLFPKCKVELVDYAKNLNSIQK